MTKAIPKYNPMGPLGLSTYPFVWWCIPLHLQHKKKGTGVTKCHIYQIVTKLQQILTTSATFSRITYETTKKDSLENNSL